MHVRAKDLTGKWVYGIAASDDRTRLLTDNEKIRFIVDPNTVCFASQRLDSRGVDIFDKDIVKTDDEYLVVYNILSEWLVGDPKLVDVYQLFHCDLSDVKNITVVGNIVDNPKFFGD